MQKVSANHALRIACPDPDLGTAAKVPRVRAHAFFDHARVGGPAARRRYSSAGGEPLAEVKLFTLPFPLYVGTRAS